MAVLALADCTGQTELAWLVFDRIWLNFKQVRLCSVFIWPIHQQGGVHTVLRAAAEALDQISTSDAAGDG